MGPAPVPVAWVISGKEVKSALRMADFITTGFIPGVKRAQKCESTIGTVHFSKSKILHQIWNVPDGTYFLVRDVRVKQPDRVR